MMADQVNKGDINKPKKWLGVRHIQALMAFLALTLSFSSRSTMSVAIVAMTDPNNENYFDWSIQRQGVILSSFSWGYVLIQAIAGELASRFGGMNLILVGVGINSLMSLILPAASFYGGWVMVCACRGIQGMTQGTIFPTMHYLISKWVPLDERARTSSLILSGSQLGIAMQFVVSGYIADFWGWPAIFYVNGAVGLVWTAIYMMVGSDNPQVSKLISAEERLYIQTSLGQIGGHKKLKTPWKAIFTSVPYLSTLVANVGFSWGYWTLFTEIPTYMSKILQVDIKSNGTLSSLPYLTMWLMNFPFGIASDYLLKSNWVTLTSCRKICNSLAFFGTAVLLCFLTYIPPGKVALAVSFLCFINVFKSGYYGGYVVVFLDISPNFCSTIFAVSNWTANVMGLFAPIFAGYILEDETSQEDWRVLFYVSSAVYTVSNIVFLLFATSKVQKWNEGVQVKRTIKA